MCHIDGQYLPIQKKGQIKQCAHCDQPRKIRAVFLDHLARVEYRQDEVRHSITQSLTELLGFGFAPLERTDIALSSPLRFLHLNK
jgi:hypothetical protein